MGFGGYRMLLWINYWWFGISRRLLWSHLRTFTVKYWWFRKLQDAAANPLLMVWNLEEFAVKPFEHFYNKILMVLEASRGCVNPLLMLWNLQEVAVKSFAHFLHWNIVGFGIFRRLLWIHYWWFGISRRLPWSHWHTFTMKYLLFLKLQEAAVNPLLMVWNLQ